VVLDAVAAAFDGAMPLATRRVLFGLLFISPVEEEEAEMVMLLQPLLALLMPVAGCNDDTVICLPGEAEKKCSYNCSINEKHNPMRFTSNTYEYLPSSPHCDCVQVEQRHFDRCVGAD